MKVPPANENTIEAILRVNPTREVVSSLDEQELAISVPNSNGERRELKRDLEEKEDSEPFIIEVVTESKLAMEVREVGGADTGGRWGRGERKSEGFVLPYVTVSERRKSLNNLEVKGLEGGRKLTGCSRIEQEIRENGVENGIIRKPRVFLRKDRGGRKLRFTGCRHENRSSFTENVGRGSVEVAQNLLVRIAETEARVARARAREAELHRRLEEMKRFVSVMEILVDYLKRQYRERQQLVARLLSRWYR
ncbi:hypothetical protein L6164_027335 [Bauhinia variegata]|uniref:Uncharacterized protein n=1 Tax=Bauhinia variegata TaxID=167791 RepID=A0ACB9LT15_BAUVA|nr:hypothetical protein L6164_027335 [Bauhinia variegata]